MITLDEILAERLIEGIEADAELVVTDHVGQSVDAHPRTPALPRRYV